MPSWPDRWGQGTRRGKEALGVPRCLTPRPAPRPLAGRGVGILRPLVQAPRWAVLHARTSLGLRGPLAVQLVGDAAPRHGGPPRAPLTAKRLRGLRVAAAWPQQSPHVAVLVAGPPEVGPCPWEGEQDRIQMPRVARAGTPPPERVGVLPAKWPAPLPEGFIRDDDPPCQQACFHVAVAQAAAAVQPDRLADDLAREAVVLRAVDRGCVHTPRMAHQASAKQAAQQVDNARTTGAETRSS